MIKDGTYCSFDFSEEPAKQNFADLSIKYVDDLVPILFGKLNQAVPAERLEIKIKRGTPYPKFIHASPDKREILIPEGFDTEDLGTFIHECVHWTQLPIEPFQTDNQFLIEGIADYYRIILSKDHQGDCGLGNNRKKYLISVFQKDDNYDSASEYIAFLRLLSKDENLIPSLNDLIRASNSNGIIKFFNNHFNKPHDELLECYVSIRPSVVGDPDIHTRYDFYTQSI